MPETPEPALTPEQWGSWSRRRFVEFQPNGEAWATEKFTTEPHRHALAALALHSQLFGFILEDVLVLRQLSTDVAGDSDSSVTFRAWAGDLAARIEALLPPEAPE